MGGDTPKIIVSPLDDLPAIALLMTGKVNGFDLQEALIDVLIRLEHTQQPLYIIFNMNSASHEVPLSEFVREALRGPYKHPMLAEWLMIGGSMSMSMAMITLTKITQRENYRWFDSHEEALAYIRTQLD